MRLIENAVGLILDAGGKKTVLAVREIVAKIAIHAAHEVGAVITVVAFLAEYAFIAEFAHFHIKTIHAGSEPYAILCIVHILAVMRSAHKVAISIEGGIICVRGILGIRRDDGEARGFELKLAEVFDKRHNGNVKSQMSNMHGKCEMLSGFPWYFGNLFVVEVLAREHEKKVGEAV